MAKQEKSKKRKIISPKEGLKIPKKERIITGEGIRRRLEEEKEEQK